jgi:hypothetical protein
MISSSFSGIIVGSFFCLFLAAKLDHQTSYYYDRKPQPRRHWDGLFENVAAAQYAHQREKGDVNPKQLREIQGLCGIDDQTVRAKDNKARDNKQQPATPQAPTNGRITTHLKQSRHDEDEPGKACHKFECHKKSRRFQFARTSPILLWRLGAIKHQISASQPAVIGMLAGAIVAGSGTSFMPSASFNASPSRSGQILKPLFPDNTQIRPLISGDEA